MDLFAGAVNRENASDVLWVCDLCFKYMTDGTSWEVHMVCSCSPFAQAMEGSHVNVHARRDWVVVEEVYAQASAG